MLCVINC